MDKNFKLMKEKLLAVDKLEYTVKTPDTFQLNMVAPEVVSIIEEYYNNIDLKIGDVVTLQFDPDIFKKMVEAKTHPSYLYVYGTCVITDIKVLKSIQEYKSYLEDNTRFNINQFLEYKNSFNINPIFIKTRSMVNKETRLSYSKTFKRNRLEIMLDDVENSQYEAPPVGFFSNVFSCSDIVYMSALRKNSKIISYYDTVKDLFLPSNRERLKNEIDKIPI